jgi:hypothetical protein
MQTDKIESWKFLTQNNAENSKEGKEHMKQHKENRFTWPYQ